MMKTIASLFSSKKFLVAIASVVAYVVSIWGLDIPVEKVLPVLGVVGVWLGAQGAADAGKERAKIDSRGV